MWPFARCRTTVEQKVEAPAHAFCRTCLTCADMAGRLPAAPAKPAEPEPEPPAFAFDTAIGRVYAVEYTPGATRESLAKLPGSDREYTRREVACGMTTISYTTPRPGGGEYSTDTAKEFVSVLTVEQHNEIVRQWLAGWRTLQWPRPADKLP